MSESLIDVINEQLKMVEHCDWDMDATGWLKMDGILITGNQAKTVLEMYAFIGELVTAGGKYPEANGTEIVSDAYKILDKARGDFSE